MKKVDLPQPVLDGPTSLEHALRRRRSVREYADRPLSREHVSQLLWSLQGVTDDEGDRVTPSAGALFPLEIYVALPEGLAHYLPHEHQLGWKNRRDLRGELAEAAYDQSFLRDAAAVFVITAVAKRTRRKYGAERTPRYVYLEAGHAAQNLLLQATALGLGSVPVGAFEDDEIHRLLELGKDEAPLYLLPVGFSR